MKKPILIVSSIMIMLLIGYGCTSPEKKTTQQSNEQAQEQLQSFPEPKEGYVRHVLLLPELSNEKELNQKVEIFAGKTLLLDCNQHRLSGELKAQAVENYGYEYYFFKTDGRVESTLMLCPDSTKTEKFVHAPSVMTYYDSACPLVIYTPESYEIRYKVWEASEMQKLHK